MVIAADGPAYIFFDNKYVLYNTIIPDYTLNKKAQGITYHLVREGAARDECRAAYVNIHENPQLF